MKEGNNESNGMKGEKVGEEERRRKKSSINWLNLSKYQIGQCHCTQTQETVSGQCKQSTRVSGSHFDTFDTFYFDSFDTFRSDSRFFSLRLDVIFKIFHP